MPMSVTLYTTESCPFCVSAKALLAKRGIAHEEINLARDPDGRAELQERTGMFTFPRSSSAMSRSGASPSYWLRIRPGG